jgi:hypothetical protein
LLVSWREIAFLTSAAAAVIHFGATHEHLREYPPAACFMVASGVAQLAWALIALRRPSRPVLALGIAGNAGIVVLWVVSRTSGLPFGAMRFMPEPIGGTDLVATVLEILVLVACVQLARGRIWPGPVLMRVALATVVITPIARSDDPVRERAIAVAGLALAFVLHAAIRHVPPLAGRFRRSNDASTSSVRVLAGPGLHAGSRAAVGAR